MSIQTWEITLLTPLHIGDGQELQRNIDFSPQSGRLDVIDMEAFFDTLQDYPKAVGEIGQARFDLTRFAADYKISLPRLYTLPLAGATSPDSLRQFIKDAHHRPYLPGSTLKGALRTALQAEFNRSRLPGLNLAGRNASRVLNEFQRAVKGLDGADPHHDFLRPLTVSDSHSVAPEGSLQADEIKFFNLRTGDQPGWKDFKSKKTLAKFTEAAGVYVESLKPGVKMCVQVKLDDAFLTSPVLRRLTDLPPCRGLDSLDALVQAVNQHSLAIARAEQQFFAQYKPEAAHAAAAYQNIGGAIADAVAQPGKTMYLRMAWGSGWRGMTGNWLQDEQLHQFRALNQKLGKPGVAIFPKTRRLALQDGIPCLPPGWVQVVVLPAAHFQQEARLVQTPPAALPTNAAAAAPASPPSAAGTPEPQSAETRTTEGQASATQASESRPAEIWRDVLITWNAGSGGIATITGPDDKRVEIKTRAATETLIPVACHSTLFHKKKRKATLKAVTVTPIGGRYYQVVNCEE